MPQQYAWIGNVDKYQPYYSLCGHGTRNSGFAEVVFMGMRGIVSALAGIFVALFLHRDSYFPFVMSLLQKSDRLLIEQLRAD